MSTKKKPVVKSAKPIGLFVVIDFGVCRESEHIPRSSNPTKVHNSMDEARAEASRLASVNIGKSFGVFSCAGFYQATAPTPQFREPLPEDAYGEASERRLLMIALSGKLP